MKPEAEIARTTLSMLTGVPYEITSPARPAVAERKPTWYVACTDGANLVRVAYSAESWADPDGRVWVESADLGSTTRWVEESYGEEGAVKVMDIDYRNLSLDEVQSRLRAFPKVTARIETCRRILNDVSGRTGVRLAMLCEGKEGVAWFVFRAPVAVKDPDGLKSALQKTVRALKEAYNLVESSTGPLGI